MTNLRVTYQDMSAAAAGLRTGRADIESVLSRLQSAVTALVSNGYVTDGSSKSFQAAYDEFNAGVRQVVQGLDGMGTYLDTAAATFEQADQELARALHR
jgi:WXG100 family type VII secretion target